MLNAIERFFLKSVICTYYYQISYQMAILVEKNIVNKEAYVGSLILARNFLR